MVTFYQANPNHTRWVLIDVAGTYKLLAEGYSPDDAAKVIATGAWLATEDVSPQTVADVNRYRAEQDRRGEREVASRTHPSEA